MKTRCYILVGALVASGCAEQRFATAPPTFRVGSPTPTGALSAPRRDHTALLLRKGKVLIVSGTGVGASVAELYDPATAAFTTLGPTVFGHPQGASATELKDGRVLIVGGINSATSAEIFDPATSTFHATAGRPNASRAHHSATLLADGRVVLAGGQSLEGGERTHALSEIFDPADESFTPAGDLNEARAGHAATMLSDGRVLVVGGHQTTAPGFGVCLASAEIFDPGARTFSPTGSMAEPRCSLIFSGITLLRDGRVLVFGWQSVRAELFDPGTGSFAATGTMATMHNAGTATLLRDGRVLVAGGVNEVAGAGTTTAAVEIYDPRLGVFSPVAALTVPRQQHSATRLRNGRVLIAGGFDSAVGADLSSAELYPVPSRHIP